MSLDDFVETDVAHYDLGMNWNMPGYCAIIVEAANSLHLVTFAIVVATDQYDGESRMAMTVVCFVALIWLFRYCWHFLELVMQDMEDMVHCALVSQ